MKKQANTRINAGEEWEFRRVRAEITNIEVGERVSLAKQDEARLLRCLANNALQHDLGTWGKLEVLVDPTGAGIALVKTQELRTYTRLAVGKLWEFRSMRFKIDVDGRRIIDKRDEQLASRSIANNVMRTRVWSASVFAFLLETSGVGAARVAKYLRVSQGTVEELCSGRVKVSADAVAKLRPYFWRKIFRRKLPISVAPGTPGLGRALYEATILLRLAKAVEDHSGSAL